MRTNPTHRIHWLGCFLVLLAASVPATAQDPSRMPQQMKPPASSNSVSRPPSSTPVILFSSDEDYKIGISDVIEVRIDDAPELSGTFRVGAKGTIPMPFLGNVVARDKTVDELSKLIANGLREQYLKDPRVSIAVLQYNSRSFFIQGAVRQPGVYQIEGRPSLLKLITIAGGLADDHGSTAFIIREVKHSPADGAPSGNMQKPDGVGTSSIRPASDSSGGFQAGLGDNSSDMVASSDASVTKTPAQASTDADDASGSEAQYEMHQVNINGILKGNFAKNVPIEPGDIINIPPTDVFFVAGEVRSPGSYPLKDGTTVRQAISLAQGTTFKAKTNKGVIFREDPKTGTRTEVPIDIGAIMSGKQADIPIMANDVVIVPNSRFKSVGSTLLTAFGVNSARFPVY